MINYRLYPYAEIDSTNAEAKRLARRGAPEGTVVSAEAQTAGRGRGGRLWITPPGAALALSVVLRPAAQPQLAQIALLGGLAVLEGIRQVVDLPMQIKWPNDVLVGGQKVAGVLAEAEFMGEQLEFVVLGLGVNVNAGPPADLKLEYAATSLAEAAGTTLNRAALQSAILDALAQRYAQLGSPQLVAAWAENLALRGEQVNVVGVTETLTGRLAGVTESGALLLELAGGAQRAVPAGAVHLRRAEPAPDLHQNFGGSKLGVKSTEAH